MVSGDCGGSFGRICGEFTWGSMGHHMIRVVTSVTQDKIKSIILFGFLSQKSYIIDNLILIINSSSTDAEIDFESPQSKFD